VSYSLVLKPSVEKDLTPLPKTIILKTIKEMVALQKEPLPQGAIKLSGTENLYRIRMGDYRIVYEINHKEKQVIIHYIRHRREVYRDL
jgi:mRNA interferase RelE/StbE